MDSKAFNRFFYITLGVIVVLYWIGMHLPLMDIDAADYASISKQMFHTGSYLQVYSNGADYLDKPPLLFWLACISFKIFGVHDWAFRLPSALCLAFGIYSLYRYTKMFYSEQTAKIAVLITASCVASYLMISDVRTDTLLTSWVMFSLWQLAEFNRSLKFKNILLGAIGIGLAMLSKGPIGLIIPVTAFIVEFAYKRQWKSFFRWQYILALLVIAIILLPMSYGLYEQFDLHPEKVLYEKTGTSGLRFFYWTQSFGRITGESNWNNNPDPFFLFHSFLWSFAPWSILFIPALIAEVRDKIKNFKTGNTPEVMTVGAFILIFFFLARSKYQLPHYTFPLHLLAAIITAKYLNEQFSLANKTKVFSVFYGLQIFFMIVVFALLFFIIFLIFPAPVLITLVVILSFAGFIYSLVFLKSKQIHKIFFITLIPFATLVFIMDLHFYPSAMKYQTGSIIGKRLNEIASPDSKLYIYNNISPFTAQFYFNYPVVEYRDENKLKADLVPGKSFILTDTADVKTIKSIDPRIVVIETYYDHPPAQLSWKFLNPATRNSALTQKVLMKY
jgi:4-amino-4-deoxy-L-arabinose transferase-like glycosyltransferase